MSSSRDWQDIKQIRLGAFMLALATGKPAMPHGFASSTTNKTRPPAS